MPDSMRGSGGGGMLPRGAGPMLRPPLGASGPSGGMGPGQYGMLGGSLVGMGGGPYGVGYHGGPNHLIGGPMHGPGHHAGPGTMDPLGQGAPAPSPFAARHQQLASPGAGSDYGGYGSRGGSDVGASPGPRLGSEAHTPGRGPQSEQACSEPPSLGTRFVDLLLGSCSGVIVVCAYAKA